MRLELHHLRVLATIAEHGSLTKAAAALGVSQPALSSQLRRVEAELGAPVFARSARGVSVTVYGDFVLARVRGALSNMDSLLAGTPSAFPLPERVSLGVFEGPLMTGLVDILEELIPGCSVTVHSEYSTLLLLELVASRKLGVALIADHPGYEVRPPQHVTVRPVLSEPGFAAMPAGHPLARQIEIDLASLAHEAWIVPPSDGTGWPEHMLDACRTAGFAPAIAHNVVDNRLQHFLIGSGRAVAIVQATTACTTAMAVRPLVGDPCWMRFQLAWHRDSPVNALGDLLVSRTRKLYESLSTSAVYLAWKRRRAELGKPDDERLGCWQDLRG